MEIKIADPCGFCHGASRIVKLAESNDRAYSLGPILHNEQLIEKLRKQGIEPLSLDEILEKEPAKVIIRAHGVPADYIKRLKDKGFEIIDGTCPNVNRVYCVAEDHEHDGYKMFIFGDKSHPEVIGIVSRLKDPIVVGGTEDIPEEHYGKVCLVSQTTQMVSRYEAIKKALLEKCDKLNAIDTICPATQERQNAAALLAKEADLMLVIGGEHSSNTKKLFSVCSKYNARVHMIQAEDNLDREWFNGVYLVGITAGASTPDFIIDSVKLELEKY